MLALIKCQKCPTTTAGKFSFQALVSKPTVARLLVSMVWLRGNLSFSTLRSRVLSGSEFADRMIHYLEKVIIQSVDESIFTDPEVNLPATGPSASDTVRILRSSTSGLILFRTPK
jgi:hypothetical protein